MKIRFETTIADVIAFNRFHFSKSPAWRKQVWVQSLVAPVVLAVILTCLFALIVVSNAHRDHATDLLVLLVMSLCVGMTWLAGSIGWVVFMRWHLNRTLIRNTRKFLAEGSNRAMYGWREMAMVDGRLILHTALVDISMDLRAIERIVSNDEYTYVYITSISAYMIPMNVYPESECREFVAELREAWENRDVPIRADEDSPRRRQANDGIVEKDW